MSINWVMLTPTTPPTFTPLPQETTLYTSPPRTSFTLSSPTKYPGHSPLHIASPAGTLHLTTHRIIYLPTTPSPTLLSFAAPLLNTSDSHVSAPWIGPNVWVAAVRPVHGGGIPAHHHVLEVRFTFRDGGAYDFHAKYETVKERLQHAVEVARESGAVVVGDGAEVGRGRGGGALAAVDVSGVHLDELPAYEEEASSGVGQRVLGEEQPPPLASMPPPSSSMPPAVEELPERTSRAPRRGEVAAGTGSGSPDVPFSPPDEPPPGYEEVQRETVEDELERRLSDRF